MNYRGGICFALIPALIGLSGCSSMVRPKAPAPLNPSSAIGGYKTDDFKTDYGNYKTAFDAGNFELARTIRDRIINRIRLEIDYNYHDYEDRLFLHRANWSVSGDVLELGLGLATTISNGERVKTVLGAILTSVQGTRLSIEKNVFRDKTTDVIITQMRANRGEVRNRILGKIVNFSADKYPFEEAWTDLVEMFFAGTLPGGLQKLADEAGRQAADAAKKETELEELRIVTKGELGALKKIRNKFNELFNKKNRAEAEAALTALGVAFTAAMSNEDVFKALNEQIAKNSGDVAGLERLMKALKVD